MEDFAEQVADIIYSQYFFDAAMGMTNNKHDAKDLIQDSALKALRFEDSFNGGNLGGWIYTILKNTFINKTRFHYYHRIKLYENPEILSNEWMEPEVYTNERSSGASSDLEWLNDAINKLHRVNREPIKMAIDGYKMHEISGEIGVPEGTIKSRIFKGKKQLKEMYGHQNKKI
jgi:RNA polymerase sigma-70 factor (ECF subfamily)